jgi:hypothetical protein
MPDVVVYMWTAVGRPVHLHACVLLHLALTRIELSLSMMQKRVLLFLFSCLWKKRRWMETLRSLIAFEDVIAEVSASM